MSVSIQTIYGTLDEKNLKELKGAIEEINNYLNEIELRQKLIKEILDVTYDNTKIPKKVTSRLAKVYHKQSFQQESEEYKEFESLFESITEIK
jgi:hypothetical protein